MKTALPCWLFVTSSLLVAQSAWADTSSNYSFTAFSQMSRVSLWGLTNDTDRTGNADVFIPTLSNSDSLLYTDVQGRWGSGGQGSGWFAGVGSGYRYIANNEQILGGYVFLDRNQSPHDSIFWIASPGIEAIGPIWEERANGYIPIGSQQNKLSTAFGHQIGIYNGVNFSGHDAYDHIYNTVEETGPGADIEVGRLFPQLNNLHAYLGSYYFSMPESSDVRGVEGRLEYPANRYVSVLAEDSFDNLNHNTFMVGVKLNIGAINPASKDIHDHLLDQVDRHVGMLDMATGVPTNKVTYETNHNVLQDSNVWFFNSGGITPLFSTGSGITANSCTYEHPCSGAQFNQTDINQINALAPHADFYLAPGNYPANNNLTLQAGQSIYGRNNSFQAPGYVTGVSSTIDGALTLDGDNTVDSINLFNDNHAQVVGVMIADANNVNITHSTIGALNGSQGYLMGVVLENAHNVNIADSTINAYSTSDFSVEGVDAIHNSNFVLNHDTINAASDVKGNYVIADAYGIYVDDSTGSANAVNVNDFVSVTGDQAFAFDNMISLSNNADFSFNGKVNSTVVATGNNMAVNNFNLTDDSGSTLNFSGDITSNSTINGNNGRILSGALDTLGKSAAVINYNGGEISTSTTINGVDGFIQDTSTYVSGNSTVNMTGVTINSKDIDGDAGSRIVDTALYATGADAKLNFSNGTVTENESADGATDDLSFYYTAYAHNGANIHLDGSTFNIKDNSSLGNAEVIGLEVDSPGSVITANNNTFNLTADGLTEGKIYAIAAAVGNSTIDATNNVFNLVARINGSQGNEIDAAGPGNIINNDNEFNND